MEATHTVDSECHADLDVGGHNHLDNSHCAQLNRGVLSGHPMGDHSRLLPTSLVLLLIFSILVPFSQHQNVPELEPESSLSLVSTKSGGLIDVPNWRVGDQWIYDAEFDVENLLASGGITGASVGTLTGQLDQEVVDIRLETIDNVSTIVYQRDSSGLFTYSGASIPYDTGFLGTINIVGDLEVDFDLVEVIRASDLGQISIDMTLNVDLESISGTAALLYSRIDLADISIDTDYSPPKEIYDFPIGLGEVWDTYTTTTTTWSGSVFEDLFPIPDDTQEQTTERFEVVGSGDPGVAYSGCSNAYNVTAYNASSGTNSGYRWWCPGANNDAWWHQSIELGADIDFRLNQYTPVSRVHEIDVDLLFPAWPLDMDLGVWVNVSTSSGQPVANQEVEFRYEIEEDIRTVTTAANGSAYLMFDTGHEVDPSPTSSDYASHGVIAWIPSTEEIGASTITTDYAENFVQVDLLVVDSGVSITRTRDGVSQQLNSITGFNVIPDDQLTFSIPVQNIGILAAPSTTLEIEAPDGSTAQVNIPSLSPLGTFTADVAWTVPQSQPIGDIQIQYEVDPTESITEDADRSNNQGSLTVFVGRLPTATIANMSPQLTFEAVTIDASQSIDTDGGTINCVFGIEMENGTIESQVAPDCMVEKTWENDGEYVVNLTIVDDEGDVTQTSVLAVINNRPAVVNLASSNPSVMVGQAVTFNAYDHSDIDTQTPEAPIDMLWMPPDAPNGVPYTCSQGLITQTCTVIPEVEGQFTMSFRAVDDDLAITTASTSITVTNIAPYNASIQLRDATTGEPAEQDSQGVWIVDEDQPIELLGFVEDSPNDLPTMRWEWQPDSQSNPSWFESTQGPTSVVPVSWLDQNMVVIVLQVFDNDDETTGTISAYVRINNVAPTIEPFENPLPLWEDQAFTFIAEFGDTASDVDNLTACWDLDPFINLDQEGSSDDDCDVSGATIENHMWSKSGVYPAIFHVTDDNKISSSQTVNFTVRNRAPVADIWVSNGMPTAGEMFGLSGNLTNDTATDKPDLKYEWDFDITVDSDGDSNPANDLDGTEMEVWTSFDEPGERVIRLTVKDDDGSISTKDYTITVMESDAGFFAFFGGGGIVSIIVMILGMILVGLLGILAWTSLRGRNAGDPWDQVSPMGLEIEQEAPMAAPPSDMFAAPAAQPIVSATPEPVPAAAPVTATGSPPVPAEGLPPGWTMEQWDHYGAQWLAQQAAAQPVPAAAPVVENPFSAPTSAEDDLDLDF